MTSRSTSSRHAVDSCALQLRAWNPFQIQTIATESSTSHPLYPKKHCRLDRSTAPGEISLDLSKLTLLDDPMPQRPRETKERGFQWFARKRRRNGGSRSVSGRSSDRSGTRRRCCSVGGGASGAYATCSDFPMAAGGTDSSGELFVNGDGNWGSDASEARVSKKEVRDGVGSGGGSERDGLGFGSFQGWNGVSDLFGNESGYGSETGYKGDAEFGYEDELDEEEDDGRLLFWGGVTGGRFEDKEHIELATNNALPELKSHPRCRRKKNVIGE